MIKDVKHTAFMRLNEESFHGNCRKQKNFEGMIPIFDGHEVERSHLKKVRGDLCVDNTFIFVFVHSFDKICSVILKENKVLSIFFINYITFLQRVFIQEPFSSCFRLGGLVLYLSLQT